jgi:RNA polymerase-binding transcription factor DksA
MSSTTPPPSIAPTLAYHQAHIQQAMWENRRVMLLDGVSTHDTADVASDFSARQVACGLMEIEARQLRQFEHFVQITDPNAKRRCEDCNGIISRPRLRAMPTVTRCITCQSVAEGCEQSGSTRLRGALRQ